MRFLLVVAVMCLLGPMALGQTGTALDPVIEDATQVGPVQCPRGSLCASEATRDAREQAFAAQMSSHGFAPSADGIGYVVIPADRAPLVVTPPTVDLNGRFALLVLLTNFPTLPESYALLEAFGPTGERVYGESAPLYKDVGTMTSALVFFELVPGQGSTNLVVTVGGHHFEVSLNALSKVDNLYPCQPGGPPIEERACSELACLEDEEPLGCMLPQGPCNVAPCDDCTDLEDLCGLGCVGPCTMLCYATDFCRTGSASVQASTPGCDLPLAVSPPVGAYDEEGQYDEDFQLITSRDINYMALLWARRFSYASNCEQDSGGGGLMAVSAGWRGPSRPVIRSVYGLDAQFVYHGDKCYGPWDNGEAWVTSNWGSCRRTASHLLWIKPRAQAMIPPGDSGVPNFEFFEQLGPTFFNGVDTDETDCSSWQGRAADATGYFGLLVGLATKLPSWSSAVIGVGTFVVEQFLDRSACRFKNYEAIPGPKVGGKMIGNGVEISKKYYGGLSMHPQREVQSTVLLEADKCEKYVFVGSFGAEWSLYASTRMVNKSTGRMNEEPFTFQRSMDFPCT